MIEKINCTVCGMSIEVDKEQIVTCKNCGRTFDTSEFNLNAKQDEPLAVFSFNNDK